MCVAELDMHYISLISPRKVCITEARKIWWYSLTCHTSAQDVQSTWSTCRAYIEYMVLKGRYGACLQPGQALLIPRNIPNRTKRKRFCEYLLLPLCTGLLDLLVSVSFPTSLNLHLYYLVNATIRPSSLCKEIQQLSARSMHRKIINSVNYGLLDLHL